MASKIEMMLKKNFSQNYILKIIPTMFVWLKLVYSFKSCVICKRGWLSVWKMHITLSNSIIIIILVKSPPCNNFFTNLLNVKIWKGDFLSLMFSKRLFSSKNSSILVIQQYKIPSFPFEARSVFFLYVKTICEEN